MTERNILIAVARAGIIICTALRIGRLALCVGLGLLIGKWLTKERD